MSYADHIERSDNTMAERTIYSSKYATLEGKDFTMYDGTHGEYIVLTTGTGGGAIIVPVVNIRGINYFGLVEEYRLPIDKKVFGFPRGAQEPGMNAEETGRKELAEETGITECDFVKMGTIHPDNGVMSNEVTVFFAQTATKPEGHVDPETGGTTQWFTYGKLLGMILGGEITCGLSIAALLLVKESGRLR